MKNKRKPIYFSSDLHISHHNVLKYSNRPFKNVDEMKAKLIKRFNSTIPENGVCYFIGDMGLGKFDDIKDFISQLNFDCILVVGNHDKGYNSMYDCGFKAVVHGLTMNIANELVTISHCPLTGAYRENTKNMRGHTIGEHWHKEVKNSKYSVQDNGQFHLSGHIHSSNSSLNSRKTLIRQYDVGIDANNYAPVSLGTIESWIAKTKKKINTWKYYTINKKINLFGEVMSDEIIKPILKDDGYLYVEDERVDLLVAKMFLGDKTNSKLIHKNTIKIDNDIDNLEWVDLC